MLHTSTLFFCCKSTWAMSRFRYINVNRLLNLADLMQRTQRRPSVIVPCSMEILKGKSALGQHNKRLSRARKTWLAETNSINQSLIYRNTSWIYTAKAFSWRICPHETTIFLRRHTFCKAADKGSLSIISDIKTGTNIAKRYPFTMEETRSFCSFAL